MKARITATLCALAALGATWTSGATAHPFEGHGERLIAFMLQEDNGVKTTCKWQVTNRSFGKVWPCHDKFGPYLVKWYEDLSYVIVSGMDNSLVRLKPGTRIPAPPPPVPAPPVVY